MKKLLLLVFVGVVGAQSFLTTPTLILPKVDHSDSGTIGLRNATDTGNLGVWDKNQFVTTGAVCAWNNTQATVACLRADPTLGFSSTILVQNDGYHLDNTLISHAIIPFTTGQVIGSQAQPYSIIRAQDLVTEYLPTGESWTWRASKIPFFGTNVIYLIDTSGGITFSCSSGLCTFPNSTTLQSTGIFQANTQNTYVALNLNYTSGIGVRAVCLNGYTLTDSGCPSGITNPVAATTSNRKIVGGETVLSSGTVSITTGLSSIDSIVVTQHSGAAANEYFEADTPSGGTVVIRSVVPTSTTRIWWFAIGS